MTRMPRRNVMGAHDLSSGFIDFICVSLVVTHPLPTLKISRLSLRNVAERYQLTEG